MKKLMLAATILAVGTVAQARDSFDGCGLGWEVVQEKTMLATTTSGTTNAFVPPTFGMTTGTIGCDKFEGFAANEKSNAEYVAKNFEALRMELAKGEGQYVDAAAESFSCDAQTFGTHVQKNYDQVVAPAKDGVELYNNLKAEAAKACS